MHRALGSLVLLLAACGSDMNAGTGFAQATQIAGAWAKVVSPPVALALHLQEAQRVTRDVAAAAPRAPGPAPAALVGAYHSHGQGRGELLVLDAAGGFTLYAEDEAGAVLARGRFADMNGGLRLEADSAAEARVLLGHPDREFLDVASPQRQRFVPLTAPRPSQPQVDGGDL